MTTHLVIPDQHAHPDFHNKRADWLGQLIKEVRPDVVINIGDAADMPSLSSYDKGTKGFQGRNYRKDIDAHLDFQERMWAPMKRAKKKRPYRVVLEGNHEWRIKRAINVSPELDGAISFNDLDFSSYYDEVVEYSGTTPGVITLGGIGYAHYHLAGVSGRAISGEHQAYTMLTKLFTSATQGHTHTTDYAVRTNLDGSRVQGLVAGCYQDYLADWAGECNRLWWHGVVLKHNLEKGYYDPQWIGIDALRKEYG
jgi:hypothetical protein